MATDPVNVQTSAVELRNHEVAKALDLRIKFLRNSAQHYTQSAHQSFEGNKIAEAYRYLGKADAAREIARELDSLCFQIKLGEPVHE